MVESINLIPSPKNMNKYAFSYYGEPSFQSPDEGKKHMAEWRSWMQSLGKSIVDPGVPLRAPKTVSLSGVKDGDMPKTSRLILLLYPMEITLSK